MNQYAVHLSKIAFVKKSRFPLLFHILGNMLGLGELSHHSFVPGDFWLSALPVAWRRRYQQNICLHSWPTPCAAPAVTERLVLYKLEKLDSCTVSFLSLLAKSTTLTTLVAWLSRWNCWSTIVIVIVQLFIFPRWWILPTLVITRLSF